MANEKNPFRFGSVVSGDNFIDRKDKIKFVRDVISSDNHLVIIAPRRFGKTSLALQATADMKRHVININFQNVIDEADFARQLIKCTLRSYPFEKIKYAFSHFSITPTISTDPVTGNIEVSLASGVNATAALDDAFALLEKIGARSGKPIVIFDEFQDADSIAPGMLKRLRSIMQLQSNVNYILLGSQESMMREIFEKKKSPFYHFGILLHLSPLPADELMDYLTRGFALCYEGDSSAFARQILDFTQCHPYYTQELAFFTWNELKDLDHPGETFVEDVIHNAVNRKDYDYERLWQRLTGNNKKVMKALALDPNRSIYTKDFLTTWGFNATSTVRGSVNRLLADGYIVYDELQKSYRVEDPFFAQWLRQLP